jgi:hypothetical protein
MLRKSPRAHPGKSFMSPSLYLDSTSIKRRTLASLHPDLDFRYFVVVPILHSGWSADRLIAAELAVVTFVVCRQCESAGIVHLFIVHCIVALSPRRQSLLVTHCWPLAPDPYTSLLSFFSTSTSLDLPAHQTLVPEEIRTTTDILFTVFRRPKYPLPTFQPNLQHNLAPCFRNSRQAASCSGCSHPLNLRTPTPGSSSLRPLHPTARSSVLLGIRGETSSAVAQGLVTPPWSTG